MVISPYPYITLVCSVYKWWYSLPCMYWIGFCSLKRLPFIVLGILMELQTLVLLTNMLIGLHFEWRWTSLLSPDSAWRISSHWKLMRYQGQLEKADWLKIYIHWNVLFSCLFVYKHPNPKFPFFPCVTSFWLSTLNGNVKFKKLVSLTGVW